MLCIFRTVKAYRNTHTHTHTHTHAGLEDAQKVLERETSESVWLFLSCSAETVALQEASCHKHIHGKHHITSFFLWVSQQPSSTLCIIIIIIISGPSSFVIHITPSFQVYLQKYYSTKITRAHLVCCSSLAL